LILVLSIIACSNEGKRNFKNNQVIDDEFTSFLNSFNQKELPFKVVPKLDDEFSNERLMNRELAKQYICTNNEDCLMQPTGGYYNFYYSNIYDIDESFILISYYRVYSEGVDYILTTFNKSGKIIDDLIVGGQVDEGLQIESLIKEDLNIVIKLLHYTPDITESNFVEVTKVEKTYDINDDGKFMFINRIGFKEEMYFFDENESFRLKPLN